MNVSVKTGLKIGGWSIAGLFAVILAISSVYVNDEYERGVVTRFGEFQEVTGPGIQFKIPFVDSVHIADTRLNSDDFQTSVATEDGQAMGVTITINHKILTDQSSISNLYSQFGPQFNYKQGILAKLAIDRAKGVIGQYPMEEFMPKREEIRMKAARIVTEAAQEYGVNIEDIQLSDVQLSPKYKQRLEQVAAARARAAEAAQQAREAEFTANKEIEQARGRAVSKEREADAQAYKTNVESIALAAATEREGEAKAAALKAQATVLKNSEGLVELTKAEAMKNWDGKFNPNVAMFGGSASGSGLIPFLNVADQIK